MNELESADGRRQVADALLLLLGAGEFQHYQRNGTEKKTYADEALRSKLRTALNDADGAMQSATSKRSKSRSKKDATDDSPKRKSSAGKHSKKQ